MKKETIVSLVCGLGLLLTAFIWGFAFVVVKNSLDLVGPIYMMAFRFTLASVVMCVLFARRLRRITKKTIINGSIIGFWLFISYAFQTYGCRYTTAGKNAFITTIYVILVPFLSALMLKKKLKSIHVIAAALALTGIGLLSLDGDFSVNIGDLLTAVCGVGFALQIIYIDKYSQDEDPIMLTLIQIAFTAISSWIVAPFLDGAMAGIVFNADLVKGICYLGLLSTMLAFIIQNVALKYMEYPVVGAVLMSMESVFGMLCSVIFLGEMINGRMIVGCIIMFVAIVLVEVKGEG